MNRSSEHRFGDLSIGVDIGGTFTDFVLIGEDQKIVIFKVPSTPEDPSTAVLEALREQISEPARIKRFLHGTTIATNAVLERKGAKTGLITTQGYRDVLEIGRQNRRTMYSVILEPQTPTFLAPRNLRCEVSERVSSNGDILLQMDEDSALRAITSLAEQGVTSIAICYLYAHVKPIHERQTRDMINDLYPEIAVSISSEVDPAFREYERTAVTAFDAYVKPVVNRYLQRLENGLGHQGIRTAVQVMQSRGGLSSGSVAVKRPVRLFLSGPAAGVIGGAWAGVSCGCKDLVTVDIGGTSSDIALVRDGHPLLRPECEIAGYPVRVPVVDVNTIGSGGGSVAWLDGALGLRVGPRSAGSIPGPAAYGRGGEEPTVTDASVVLGYLDPDNFAGGTMKLDREAAHRAIADRIAKLMGMDVAQAALGIHRVMNAQLAEGVRYVSIRQGFDPRTLTLVAFGGAGPLHATALARELGINQILVPTYPGVLAAMGLHLAPIEHEVSMAFARCLTEVSISDVTSVLERLDAECDALMDAEAIQGQERKIQYSGDVAYQGQSYHLEIPLDLAKADPLACLARKFLVEHERLYAYSTDSPIMIVNLRSVHRIQRTEQLVDTPVSALNAPAMTTYRDVRFDGMTEPVKAAVYDRHNLPKGANIQGPAVVEQSDSTTLIEQGWHARIMPNGAMFITRAT